MKTTSVTSLLLALSIISSPLALASEEILTPTDTGEETGDFSTDDLFGDTFTDEFVDDFEITPEAGEAPIGDEEIATEEDAETETEESEEGVEAESTEARNITTQGKIDKKVTALHERVPGAIRAKGITFLSINSKKFIGKYLPCDIEKEDTTMTALTRLKLSQGAPIDCREDVTVRTFPYRMYRRAQ